MFHLLKWCFGLAHVLVRTLHAIASRTTTFPDCLLATISPWFLLSLFLPYSPFRSGSSENGSNSSFYNQSFISLVLCHLIPHVLLYRNLFSSHRVNVISAAPAPYYSILPPQPRSCRISLVFAYVVLIISSGCVVSSKNGEKFHSISRKVSNFRFAA